MKKKNSCFVILNHGRPIAVVESEKRIKPKDALQAYADHINRVVHSIIILRHDSGAASGGCSLKKGYPVVEITAHAVKPLIKV